MGSPPALGTRTIGSVHSKCRVTKTLPNMKFSRWSETPTPRGVIRDGALVEDVFYVIFT